MGLFDFIGPASGLLFTLENIIWINLGVFIGCVFAAIPGLSVSSASSYSCLSLIPCVRFPA